MKRLGGVLFVMVWAIVIFAVLPAVYSQSPTPIPLPPGESVLACTNSATVTLVPPNRANCPVGTVTPTRTATPSPTATATATATPAPIAGFLETFDGAPAVPAPWNPADWDIAVHGRDRGTWYQLDPMTAAHGAECQPPPGGHVITAYEDTVYRCANHMMTALRADGYGVIYLTPNQLVDFSTGEAVIRLDVSTLRTTNRDWWDVWITRPQDNLVAPLEQWLPDLNGEPRNAVHVRLNFGNGSTPTGVFIGEVATNFNAISLSRARFAGYETLFIPSALQRRTFELRISKTHIRFGMPDFNFWWIDTDIPPLQWGTGVVSVGVHSYNPYKQCPACQPSTYHWDNFSISPAVPFTILRANRRYVSPDTTGLVEFPTPLATAGYLRFSGIGTNLQVSFDNGQTWQTAVIQAQEQYHSDHFRTYFFPAPIGTERVRFRGERWWGGDWHARDISLWSFPGD